MTQINKKIRNEFKYILDSYQAAAIEDYIKRLQLAVDQYSRSGSYTITSLYFDTPDLRDYYQKLAGLENRKKLRARVYANRFDDPGVSHVWLEVKVKQNMSNFKYRVPVLLKDWEAFSGGDNFFDITKIHKFYPDDLKAFSYLFLRGNYKPHAVVRYVRKAFEGDFFSNFRLTLDSQIEACHWNYFKRRMGTELVAPGKVVMEVKFIKSMPWWFRNLLEKFHLSRQAFSKYTNSVDALHKINPIPR